MQASEFDEGEFFRRIALSGARTLLIGRQALIALGIPVLTREYEDIRLLQELLRQGAK